MKEKIALWLSKKYAIPYRFRKSVIKRLCPKVLTGYKFEIDFYGMKYSGNTKDSTDRLFFMFGGCEKYMLSLMKDYYNASKHDDFVFVDVGAHTGNHSLFMSKYAKKIHAFEPNPKVRDTLNSQIYLNNISNIVVHPVGLGLNNDKLPFYVSETDHLSCGSFKQDHDERNSYYEDLEVRKGDDLFAEKHIDKVDMIKIDVEGLERDVIEGLQNMIAQNRPLIIAEISYTSRKSFGTIDDFETIFPKDYCFYQFSGVSRESDKYAITDFDYDSHKNHLDVIAVPREKRVYLLHKIVNKLKKNKVVGG